MNFGTAPYQKGGRGRSTCPSKTLSSSPRPVDTQQHLNTSPQLTSTENPNVWTALPTVFDAQLDGSTQPQLCDLKLESAQIITASSLWWRKGRRSQTHRICLGFVRHLRREIAHQVLESSKLAIILFNPDCLFPFTLYNLDFLSCAARGQLRISSDFQRLSLLYFHCQHFDFLVSGILFDSH